MSENNIMLNSNNGDNEPINKTNHLLVDDSEKNKSDPSLINYSFSIEGIGHPDTTLQPTKIIEKSILVTPILLMGYARSGKDTVGDIIAYRLRQHARPSVVHFADKLKRIAEVAVRADRDTMEHLKCNPQISIIDNLPELAITDPDYPDIEERQSGDPLSMRGLLQKIGQFFRDEIHSEFWIGSLVYDYIRSYVAEDVINQTMYKINKLLLQESKENFPNQFVRNFFAGVFPPAKILHLSASDRHAHQKNDSQQFHCEKYTLRLEEHHPSVVFVPIVADVRYVNEAITTPSIFRRAFFHARNNPSGMSLLEHEIREKQLDKRLLIKEYISSPVEVPVTDENDKKCEWASIAATQIFPPKNAMQVGVDIRVNNEHNVMEGVRPLLCVLGNGRNPLAAALREAKRSEEKFKSLIHQGEIESAMVSLFIQEELVRMLHNVPSNMSFSSLIGHSNFCVFDIRATVTKKYKSHCPPCDEDGKREDYYDKVWDMVNDWFRNTEIYYGIRLDYFVSIGDLADVVMRVDYYIYNNYDPRFNGNNNEGHRTEKKASMTLLDRAVTIGISDKLIDGLMKKKNSNNNAECDDGPPTNDNNNTTDKKDHD